MNKKYTIAAAILAGGKASRLGGIAKGGILIQENYTITNHLLRILKLANINRQIIVTSQNEIYKHYKIPIVSDLRKDHGPLAGIESALEYYSRDNEKHTKPDAVLFLPCDLPKLEYTDIMTLYNAFINGDSDVVFAKTTDQNIHPLCGIISLAAYPKVSAALDSGVKKISYMWNELNGKKVEFYNVENFLNINDLESLKKINLLTCAKFKN